MTILPKKKPSEEDSGSDSDKHSTHSASSHNAGGHPSQLVGPLPQNDGTYLHTRSPEGFYHRSHYDLSDSSSGESSPEHPSLSKRTNFRPSPAAGCVRGKKPPLDSSPGYNSSEEYDGSLVRFPYCDLEREHQFEEALKGTTGLIIKKMRPDGACLFRSVADQVYGDQEMHSIVRNHCMDYMLKNADYFSQFITDEDFEHYINRKRSDRCYGNNIEMQAVAEMYNRAIEVYQYSTEPINIFFGVYKTDNAPIRLSYHGQIHYNSVVDPYQATVGVGLGLAGFTPGLADKNLLKDATRESESVHIEKAMLEDKLRSTDWESTFETLEEAVARESYLTWLKENEQRTLDNKGHESSSTQSTSTGDYGTSSYHSSLPPPITATPTAPQSTPGSCAPSQSTLDTNSNAVVNSKSKPSNRSSPLFTSRNTVSVSTEKSSKIVKSHSAVFRVNSPAGPYHSSRGRNTPSPPNSFIYRSSSNGSQHNSVRNSPYHSPRESFRGSPLRGSARNSPRHSYQNSPRSSVSSSPSPPPSLVTTIHYPGSDHSSSSSSSPHGLPSVRKSKTSPRQGSPTLSQSPTEITGERKGLSPVEHHQIDSPPTTSNNSSGSQAPTLNLDFESGQVLSQLPYEYSSFLDLPPSALGLSEWEDDRVLAAVLAASQQEYIDSLKRTSRGAEGL